jgi:hypothetical protein
MARPGDLGKSKIAPIRFSTSSGGLVLVDVVADDEDAPNRQAGPTPTLENALQGVSTGVNVLLESLTNIRSMPDEVTLEFGIRISSQAGAVIAAQPDGAQFRAVVSYRRQAAADAGA